MRRQADVRRAVAVGTAIRLVIAIQLMEVSHIQFEEIYAQTITYFGTTKATDSQFYLFRNHDDTSTIYV